MPHPEREHSLQIEVARLQRHNEELERELAVWRDEDGREAKYEHVSQRCTKAESERDALRTALTEVNDLLMSVPPGEDWRAVVREKVVTALHGGGSVGNEVKRCEVCGESECWALADWSMGGAPGEYEEAMAKHYRLGYEREKARADMYQGLLNDKDAHLVRAVSKFNDALAALAAARRELSLLATAAGRLAVLLDGTVDWDAQGEDDGIALNAVGAIVRRVGVVTPEEFRRWDYSAALAAPAAGEEG